MWESDSLRNALVSVGGSDVPDQILRAAAHEDDKVVAPKHQPHLPPRKYTWYSFLLEAESTPVS